MEKESIAYFYLEKNAVAKQNFYSPIQLNEFCIERRDRLAIKAVGIPEYYMESYVTQLKRLWFEKILKRRIKKETIKQITWDEEKLGEILVKEFEKSGAEHFFYGEETAVFLEQKQPQIPLFFMEEMLLQYGVRENLILIGSPNLLFDSVFQNFMQRVNFLKIICDVPEDYEEEAEWLYENYGIVAEFGGGEDGAIRERKFGEEITGRRQMETLVIDMEPGGKNGRPQIGMARLAEGTVYMDMCSEGAKARWITKKRSDIHYLSPQSLLNKWCHLDTTAQNGYNTRVKLEVL